MFSQFAINNMASESPEVEGEDAINDNNQNKGKSTPSFSGFKKSVNIEINQPETIEHEFVQTNPKNYKGDELERTDLEMDNLHFFSRYRGMLFALLSSFMFSLTSMLVKFLQERHSPLTIALWRFQGALIPALILMVWKLGNERYSKQNQKIGEVHGMSFLSSVYPPRDKSKAKMLGLVLVRFLKILTNRTISSK